MSSGDAPREVHGLVAQHLELHRVIVQAVLSQNLHGPDHRLARRLVHVEQIPTEEHRVDFFPLRDLEDLAKRDERVILAHLVLLVHAEVVVRRHEDPKRVGVAGGATARHGRGRTRDRACSV